MKKLILIVVFLLAFSGVGLASPLMDYSQGKGSIDLTWRNAENSADGYSFEKKGNLDAAVTVGLGNKFAFQYRNFEPKSKDSYAYGSNLKFALNEFNVLYKLDKNVAAFAGYVTTKATYNDWYYSDSRSKNMWQVGVVGSTQIAPKTTLWGSVAAGNNSLSNWEVGVGYAFASNMEFNVNYREIKANVEDTDFKTKGLGFGLTYKF